MLKGQKMQTSPDDSAMCWEYGGLRGRKSRWQLSFQPLELGAFFFFFKNWFEDTADHLSTSSILHAPFNHMLTIFIDIIPTSLLRKLGFQ